MHIDPLLPTLVAIIAVVLPIGLSLHLLLHGADNNTTACSFTRP